VPARVDALVRQLEDNPCELRRVYEMGERLVAEVARDRDAPGTHADKARRLTEMVRERVIQTIAGCLDPEVRVGREGRVWSFYCA
jgi:hypothetical protein